MFGWIFNVISPSNINKSSSSKNTLHQSNPSTAHTLFINTETVTEQITIKVDHKQADVSNKKDRME
jgi:hypothetical protein